MRISRAATCAWLLLLCDCTGSPLPCTGFGTCNPDRECLANRCVPLGSEPVAERSQRWIGEVTEFAVIASRVDYGAGLPGAITFGAHHTGTLEVLLRFDPVWREGTSVQQAFLLLEPLPHARASAEPVDVEVWRVEQPWSQFEVDWRSQPRLAHPRSRGIADSNGAPLRVDITSLVSYLKAHPDRDFGLAVRAGAVSDTGVSYASGVSGGVAPRVEVYGR